MRDGRRTVVRAALPALFAAAIMVPTTAHLASNTVAPSHAGVVHLPVSVTVTPLADPKVEAPSTSAPAPSTSTASPTSTPPTATTTPTTPPTGTPTSPAG